MDRVAKQRNETVSTCLFRYPIKLQEEDSSDLRNEGISKKKIEGENLIFCKENRKPMALEIIM